MSDSEEEICYYGKPLEPYDEDAFPKKRPISIEEQVAKDAQGRRRFHGAFTGGFSAGFYNTVGSLEGWAPAEFKSSRSDKAQNRIQNPSDFMDDEDIGEFGIAPQTVKATDEYSKTKKRKKQIFADGPIPGEPVLDTLLQAGNETVGYFLIKNMNRKQHKMVKDKAAPKIYGCVMPKDVEDEPDRVENNLHSIYTQYLLTPKSNTYGLGYIGLDKTHVNLFQPAKLTVRERNNKKLSIAGQAFGVGAFEDEDEDIYVKDDMSRYDFELSTEASKNKAGPKGKLVFDLFLVSKASSQSVEKFPPPVIPASFSGKHNIKKSRFEPLPEEAKLPDRKDMNVITRAKCLGEDTEKNYTPSKEQPKKNSAAVAVEKAKSSFKVDDLLVLDRFVSAQMDDDVTNMLETVKPSEITHGTSELHAAVKLKMFGPLTRVTIEWQPNSLLCKRFNVPEPHTENVEKNKKRTKNLIFEYQKHMENESDHKPGLSVQKVEEAVLEEKINTEPETSGEVVSRAEKDVPVPEVFSLEIQPPVDLTDRVDVSKNADLFKAVFMSSSESESENEDKEEEDQQRKAVITASVVSEPLVLKIKPLKEGILSNINFQKFNLVEVNDARKKIEDVDPNAYGPKLPATSVRTSSVVITEPQHDDEWVEKDVAEKQKKHRKKHKKDKYNDKSKKKHKHKSKK